MTSQPVCIAALLLCISFAKAQSVSTLMGARSHAMAYASSCLDDEWSLFNNPAGLSGVDDAIVAVGYAMTPALPGSDRMAAAGLVRALQGTLSAGMFRFGDAFYSEQALRFGYGHRLGLAALGISISLIQYNATGFGTLWVPGVTLGGIAELTPTLKIGAYVVNPNQPVISRDQRERLPTRLTAGMALTLNERVLAVVEVEKDMEYDASWKAAIEYRPLGRFQFRMGCGLIPQHFSLGVGFRSPRLILDYALDYSVFIGTAHQVTAGYPLVHR
ncbi:MAG TPA: hypothetical protein VF191_06880 [Cyclobacteriaceae bacterium]